MSGCDHNLRSDIRECLSVITTWGVILENVCGSDHYMGSDIRECLWQ